MDIQDFGKHPLADRSLCQRRCSEWQWIVAPSPREGGGYLTRSADTMSVAAADKKLCRWNGRDEKNYRYFNGGITVVDFASRATEEPSLALPAAIHTVNKVPTDGVTVLHAAR